MTVVEHANSKENAPTVGTINAPSSRKVPELCIDRDRRYEKTWVSGCLGVIPVLLVRDSPRRVHLMSMKSETSIVESGVIERNPTSLSSMPAHRTSLRLVNVRQDQIRPPPSIHCHRIRRT